MRLYLCIALVGLEGSPRRMFICSYDFNDTHMMLVSLMNMLLVYIVIYDNDYSWCYVMWSYALLIISFLVCLTMWVYGTSHRHCTCELGKGFWVKVLYDVMIWTHVRTLLLWHYVGVFVVIWSWYVNIHVIWPDVDRIHVDLTLS